MSRRKKDPKVPVSTAWETYRPQDDLYWKLGGPTIPVEAIEPEFWDTRYAASHLKDPGKRAKYLRDLVEDHEQDLARSVAYYLRLDELGIEGMAHEWDKEADRRLDASPGDWTMVARNVDRQRAAAFRTIRMRKGQILAYRKLADEIEAEKYPLMFKHGKKS
jgi:hypothetical protein